MAFLVLLSGCQTGIKDKKPVPVAAESAEAASLRRIAVLQFDRRAGGPDITAEVETMLANVQVNGQPYFAVVERNKIQQVMREMKLGESGVIREDTAAKLGKMLGANGVYAGTITRNEVVNTNYQENRSRCTQYERKKDKKGNMVDGKCLNSQDYLVSCTKRTAYFTFLPKLIAVESGSIAFSKEIAGEASESACQGEAGGIADGAQLLASARSTAMGKLRVAVAPSVQMVSFTLMDTMDGIAAAAAKEKHASALEFAKAGRMDRACTLWSEALAVDSTGIPIIHNVGVCEEQRGNLSGALARYEEADRLTSKPDRIIGESLARIRDMMTNRARLQSQGNSPPPPPPVATTPAPAAVTSPAPAAAPSGPPSAAVTAQAQERLNALGFNVGKPDGTAGPRTRQAIQRFQQSKGLEVNGQLDSQTLSALGL
jgi:curli biogenesis system outer membrane secretion channel CsgG